MERRYSRPAIGRKLCHAGRMIEPLEPRRMLATFNGTAGDDTIILGINGSITHVVINGKDTTTGDLSITINAGEGDDSIQVVATRVASNVTIHGEAGNDFMENIGGDLHSSYRGSFLFDGGDGFDQVIADNTSDATSDNTITLQSDSIMRNGETFFRLTSLEDMYYRDSESSNRIEFINMGGSPSGNIEYLVVDGNGGDDVFANYQGSGGVGYLLTSMASTSMTFRGGGGSNTLELDDRGDLGAAYTISSGSFACHAFFGDTGLLGYSDFASFSLVESNQGTQTTLTSKPAGTTMMIQAGDGIDTVIVGGGDIDSNGFAVSNTTIFGGGANDAITIDDHLDTDADGTTSSYTCDNFTLAKGAAGLTYSAFESQTLKAANGVVQGQFNIIPVINLNAVSSFFSSTTIIGGTSRGAAVNVGNGNLGNIAGTLTLQDCSTVNLTDQLDTGNDDYTVSPTQFIKTSGTTTQNTITYSGASALTLNANQGSNKITINSTPAGRTTSVNDFGGGSNAYYLGGGNIGANLLGPVTINGAGAAGSNGVVLDNSLDTSPSTQTLNGGAFTDGQTHNISNVTSIYMLDGGGGGTLDVLRTTVGTNIMEAWGKVVTVGNGNMDANLLGGATINGAASVTVDDRLDTGNDTYIVDGFQSNDNVSFRKTTGAGATVGLNFCGTSTLQCNQSDNVITVNNTGPGVQIFGNGGNDRFDVLSTKPNFFAPTPTILGIDTGAENPSIPTVGDSLNISGNSTVQLLNDDTVRSLSVTGSNAKFVIPTGVACKTQTISLTGLIDLAGGSLLSLAGGPTQPTLRSWLNSGRNNGAWNGTSTSGAINSSLAASTSVSDGVGYGLGSQIVPATIGSFAIGASDTLLRCTLDGDANLDHAVNSVDFNILVANFGQLAKVWTQSDFNYDGAASSVDFNMMSSNFGQSLPAGTLQPAGTHALGTVAAWSDRPITDADAIDDLLL